VTTRYVRKPVEVEAIQWIGESNCPEVFAFLGMEHPEDELDHSVIYLDDDQEAKPRDWIIRDPSGYLHAVNPDRFGALYEAATTPAVGEQPHA
jgi:hypothetical protein